MNSCFESSGHCRTKRIHLPVADRCYANCYYCQFRENGNLSEQAMPGHSRWIPYGPQQMKEYLDMRMKLLPDCEVLGVSGPGDILSSRNQLAALIDLVCSSAYSHIPSCICTNGWDFPSAKPLLEQWKTLAYVTVTINSLDPAMCSHIYSHPEAQPQFYEEKIKSQISMLRWAAERDIMIKINTVLSDYNGETVLSTWSQLQQAAPIHIFNLLQMDGQDMTMERRAYFSRAYDNIMKQAEENQIPTKRNCKHCRADSYGRW